MCHNARKMHYFEAKKIQKFSEEGHSPLPIVHTPPSLGRGHPFPNPTPRRLWRLDNSCLRRSTLPQTKILDPPVYYMHAYGVYFVIKSPVKYYLMKYLLHQELTNY